MCFFLGSLRGRLVLGILDVWNDWACLGATTAPRDFLWSYVHYQRRVAGELQYLQLVIFIAGENCTPSPLEYSLKLKFESQCSFGKHVLVQLL